MHLTNNDIVLHGECLVFRSCLPANLKPKAPNGAGYMIVADSETTGNHHVIDAPEGVVFYENEKGVLFMESNRDTQIRCLHPDRHDAITLPPGTYEFGTQQEYDPFTARMEKVRD